MAPVEDVTLASMIFEAGWAFGVYAGMAEMG